MMDESRKGLKIPAIFLLVFGLVFGVVAISKGYFSLNDGGRLEITLFSFDSLAVHGGDAVIEGLALLDRNLFKSC